MIESQRYKIVSRCELTELERDSCAHCRGHVEERPLASSPTIAARFAGRCACCGRPYEEGQRISNSYEAGGWCLVEHVGAS